MWNKNNQKGFSLVEAMVAMALLSVAIYLGMDFIGGQQKSRGTRTKQSMHRYIAIQVTQHVNTNISFYPPIDPPTTSDKIIYVGCMSKDGVLKANKFQFHLSNSFNESTPTGLCNTQDSVYEVRFFWITPNNDDPANPDANSVKINLLTLAPGTPNSLAVHNFKIFAK